MLSTVSFASVPWTSAKTVSSDRQSAMEPALFELAGFRATAQLPHRCPEIRALPSSGWEGAHLRCLAVLGSAALLVAGARASRAAEAWSYETARGFVDRYCLSCHGGEEAEDELDLGRFQSARSVADERGLWERISQRVRALEMPPRGKAAPSPEERQAFSDWVTRTLRAAACAAGEVPGPSPIRRLNKTEYRNAVQDLLFVHYDASGELPDDGAGGVGFDNAAETLFLSAVHAEKYLDAAKAALAYAGQDRDARAVIFIVRPSADLPAEAAARRILARLATRAFRRPASDQEVDGLLRLFRRLHDQGQPFDESVLYALQAVLISPQFLFRTEAPAAGPGAEPLGDYELATRLSSFLWSSIPDDELRDLAAAGRLQDEAVLRAQIERMLRAQPRPPDDAQVSGRFPTAFKVRALAESFVGQWLGTRALGVKFKPDRERYRGYNQELELAMKEEPVRVFQEILLEDRSLLELLDADYTYANNQLNAWYGKGLVPQGRRTSFNKESIRATIAPGVPRGGILSMAAVHAVSSYPDRTSPVLRGKWVLETLLGAPPPPPPPNVPDLDREQAAGKTLREQLQIHRQKPACASCHQRIDPIGFGLENYDAVGRWRDDEDGRPLDTSGLLPDGRAFDGPRELKQLLLRDYKDPFVRHLATKMLGYALGRGLVDQDHCLIDRLVEEVKQSGYRARTLIDGIILSKVFRHRRGG